MEILVFDLEADGFLEEAENVWCISGTLLHSGGGQTKLETLSGNGLYDQSVIEFFSQANTIACHNVLGYDAPMVKEFFDYDILRPPITVLDTLVMSKLSNPDRRLPSLCPTSIMNPVTKRSQAVRPHSLEAWGYRMGKRKLQIHDWRTYDEKIIERCEGDVAINVKVLYQLIREMRLKKYEEYCKEVKK